jgi:TPR repeat protein
VVLPARTAAQAVGQQLLVERDAFNGTLLAVHTAHVTGALTAQDEAKLLPAIQSVQAALDAADAAFKSGDTKSASVYLQAVSAGLAKLAELYPATRPSTTQPARTSRRTVPDRPEAVSWYRVARQPRHPDVTPTDGMPNALMAWLTVTYAV